MRILIAYGSTHGHTARIAARISARMRRLGHDVVTTAQPQRARAKAFDAVLVGGRVHGAHYPWRVTRFIRKNLGALNSRPSAFFSVSLLQFARNSEQRSATRSLPRRSALKLGWLPDHVAVFGGALRWKEQYGRLTPLFQFIWQRALGDLLDRSLSEQVFTDWDQVDRFTDTFLHDASVTLEIRQQSSGWAAQESAAS